MVNTLISIIQNIVQIVKKDQNKQNRFEKPKKRFTTTLDTHLVFLFNLLGDGWARSLRRRVGANGLGAADLFTFRGNLDLLLLGQVRLVLDHLGAAREHLFVVLIHGVVEVDTRRIEGVLRVLEVFQRLRLLLLEQRKLFFDLLT